MQPNGALDDDERSDDADDTFDDWVESPTPCRSLVDPSRTLDTVADALSWDRERGLDLVALVRRLQLDFYGQIRLVNWLRTKPRSDDELEALSASSELLKDDAWLVPVLEDDPLLQLDLDDETGAGEQMASADGRVEALEAMLAARTAELEALRRAIAGRLEIDEEEETSPSEPVGGPSRLRPRDDDTHYFSSYADNAIHEEMLRDRVRTESYRDFIVRHADTLFKGKVVLDVGCGTGILSMFAARAGAQRVYAVDASAIAVKAERNVRDNGLEGVIEVIRGKIEELDVPPVDVIISEWMGYFLLYESMLPSVLSARDRFLKPGGLVVPTQCSILIAAIDSSELLDGRATFWDDVYGFKMSAMADGIFADALTDVVPASELMSPAVAVKDIDVQRMVVDEMDFDAPFVLRIDRSGTVKALCGYFDTFFTHDGAPTPALALDEGGQSLPASTVAFSTGPRSTPTHWKQAVFRLASPLSVQAGTTLRGQLRCTRDVDNSRELEVTVRLTVHDPNGAAKGEMVAQVWRVR